MASLLQLEWRRQPLVIAVAARGRIEDWVTVVTVFSQDLLLQRRLPEQVLLVLRKGRLTHVKNYALCDPSLNVKSVARTNTFIDLVRSI